MFRSKMRQQCRRCKGTGCGKDPAVDRDGQMMIAPPFQKGEAERPVMENCKECGGSGWAVYEAPTEILVEGQKVRLDEDARRARFNDMLA